LNEVVVIGASAGGVETLRVLVSRFPRDFPAAVFIVLHTSAGAPNLLTGLLLRTSTLPVETAANGKAIESGHIYVAPPDNHLLVQRGHMELVHGPAENGHRPAIDVLFHSAAHSHGSRVIGVVLTGYLDDGTAGLDTIKRHGGTAVVQNPDDAIASSMPQHAIDNVEVDYVAAAADIPGLLASIIREHANDGNRNKDDQSPHLDYQGGGTPSEFSCPQCNGVLWVVDDAGLLHFRCRVGHSFSPESMAAAQDRGLERVLWAALRALEERAELATRLARRAKGNKQHFSERRYLERAEKSRHDAEMLRALVSRPLEPTAEQDDAADLSSTMEKA
jgi:two-component system chemotaxis response regulator CheB